MVLNLTVSFPGRDGHEAQLSGAQICLSNALNGVTQESNSNSCKVTNNRTMWLHLDLRTCGAISWSKKWWQRERRHELLCTHEQAKQITRELDVRLSAALAVKKNPNTTSDHQEDLYHKLWANPAVSLNMRNTTSQPVMENYGIKS